MRCRGLFRKTMITELEQIINTHISGKLRDCCWFVTTHLAFRQGYGATKHHHNYKGGLVNHTYEVLMYALGIAKQFPEADLSILVISALWHDFAKIYDYETNTEGQPQNAQYKAQIHHIHGSAIEFAIKATQYDVDQEVINKVVHCILSHHGRPEWGSAIVPQTLEATILHFADYLSMAYGPSRGAGAMPIQTRIENDK